jgi:ribosome-binding ATPase YchF (GTP1/OBG family)
MERGFARCKVAGSEELLEHGSLQELHHLGLLRTEGRDYPVRDGDVVEFLFTP